MEFDENLGIHALLPSWQSQLIIFTKSLFIIVQYSQLCCLVPNFHDFLSSAHMTLTAQSVRSVGFGVLIEQILCGENFMLIGPQENVSLNLIKLLACETLLWHREEGIFYHPKLFWLTEHDMFFCDMITKY